MRRKFRISWALLALSLILAQIQSVNSQTQQVPAPPAGSDPRDQQPKDLKEKQETPRGKTAIRVSVEQIGVDVTVTDKSGNLIQGLAPENFKIYEDKVEQQITNFAPVEAPITVVLLVEYNKVIWYALYEVLDATYTFVDQIRPDDWIAVVAYDIKPEILSDFTQNKGEVYNSLRRLNYPAWSEANFYDATLDVLDRVKEIDGKVAVVMLTSGRDTFSKTNLDKVLRSVKESSAIIYPVSVGGGVRTRYEGQMSDTTRMDFYQADAVLKEFAKATGGEAYFPRFQQEYPGIFKDISSMLRNQYRLSYVSTNTARDGKFRRIRVEVKADLKKDGKPVELRARARDGYYAPKPGS
ncbi:MAG: VWA domain-containing protein [Acidobacteria bacterium]|nr:VWA domain-containing protein [Acidobacteriota bacterium]